MHASMSAAGLARLPDVHDTLDNVYGEHDVRIFATLCGVFPITFPRIVP